MGVLANSTIEATRREKLGKKWMKGLNKDLIQKILSFEPSVVAFNGNLPFSFIAYCEIECNNGVGFGISICSPLDKIDYQKGKNQSAGRAVKALVRKESTEFLRLSYQIPRSWTKLHITRLETARFVIGSFFGSL